MLVAKIIFWISLFFLFYAYIGYALITALFLKLSKAKNVSFNKDDLPGVTMLIAAYNEELFIEKKIEDTLALDYPKDRLQIIFITDGSSDATPALVAKHKEVELLHQPERRGKSAALNRAIAFAKQPIIVICDANTILNKECLKELVKYYSDKRVGGVAGEKRVISQDGLAGQEGVYWKYESALKKLDAKYCTIVGAAGELFSCRKDLWTHVEDDAILDDFMISMRIVQKGYQVKYEPLAYALETASASVKEESKRKVRIAAGGFQSMSRLLPMLNIFKYGKSSFLYISHRVLRWAVCPFCLVFVLLSGIILGIFSGNIFYQVAMILQLTAYIAIFLGQTALFSKMKIPFVKPLYYFVFMNICVIRGFFRYLRGKQTATWERAQRQTMIA